MSRISSTFKKTPNKSLKPPTKVEYQEPFEKSLRSSNGLSYSQNNLASFKEKLSKTMEGTGALEQEYIKSLQQQVYLMELENNHLRNQAIKATEMHPVMSAEAEQMITRLRASQSRIDNLELELYRKEGNESVLNSKIQQLTNLIADEQDKRSQEKQLLMDEVLSIRKDKDMLERDLSREKMQLSETRDDHTRNIVNLKSADAKVASLRAQLESEMDKTKAAEMSLSEKRSEVARLEAQNRELQNKYFVSTAEIQDQAKQQLRDEIRHLRQRLKETEISAENDRFLRSKMSDDSSAMIKENARLNQQVVELTNQLERERDLRENYDGQRSVEYVELSRLREREKELLYDLDRLREELHSDKERTKNYMNQIAQLQGEMKTKSLESTLTHKRLDEADFVQRQNSEELVKLRRDKQYLIDHVDNLQTQLKEKERELNVLQAHVRNQEARLSTLSASANIEGTLQSRRWEELEQMADTIRSHARLMASSSASPRHRKPLSQL